MCYDSDRRPCAAAEYELIGRGLDTVRTMLAEGQDERLDSSSPPYSCQAKSYLLAHLSWLENAVATHYPVDESCPATISKVLDETAKVPCTPAEYMSLISGLSVERRKLDHSLKARHGSAIYEYAIHARFRIAWLEKALSLYFPVRGYVHPEGSTVISIERGSVDN